ncbi:putative nuclease HARBI1 [Heptranchias perlo]|uniref:putative nuclease HARBI1 n=1 Tax=Heptranchias perlo TaxID=212740 RepID=UPI003559D9C4
MGFPGHSAESQQVKGGGKGQIHEGATGDIWRVSQLAAHKCIRQVTDGLFARAGRYVNFPCDDNSQNERALRFTSLVGARCHRWQSEHHQINQEYSSTASDFIPSMFSWCVTIRKGSCRSAPDSLGDAFILRQSNNPDLFVPGTSLEGWLLGDKGYPLQTWLMTALRNPTNEHQQRYDDSHVTARCVIEQAISMLKVHFRCLDRTGGSLQYSPVEVSRIIAVCCVLHNMAKQRGLEVEKEQAAQYSSSDEDSNGEEEEDEEDEDVQRSRPAALIIALTAEMLAADDLWVLKRKRAPPKTSTCA